VLPEYRGYDGVVGAPTYEGARRDAAAALAATTGRFHVRPESIFYYGHSLGSAVATELAADNPPHALILESPFTSARDMAGRMPVAGLTLFWKAISRVHYRTVERVSELDVPVYVAHGKRDVVVPARMGAAVYEAARKKGALLMVPEAGHNDVPLVGGDEYWRWLGKAVGSGAH
jgi:pimeloyl-ACP methyl ester carboxylesterase